MTTRIKVCGITTVEDALFAVEAGVDALGFIFYKDSPRYVEPRRVADIVRQLPPFVTSVGVFVDETTLNINKLVDLIGLGCAQLHGDESPELCAGINAKVIKAVRVGEGFDLSTLKKYDNVVSALLLDTYKKGLKGGTGETFDWNVAVEAKDYGKVILSGGLTPANIKNAVKVVRPYGLDVSSGVELTPGNKDHAKVKEFIREARSI